MVYNEPLYLPIWRRHYASQVGEQNCYIIDHGSTDGSTEAISGCNVVRIPRSPLDEGKRARFISKFCTSLLEWYDGVIHCDADEIIVADPDQYASLAEYVLHSASEVENVIGLDVYQTFPGDAPIDVSRPILEQRRWVRFSSSMCKPALIRRPIEWMPGFHSANAKLQFGQLYLFHLRYYDLAYGLARLEKTREMAWANHAASGHQRVSDTTFQTWFQQVSTLPRTATSTLRQDDPSLTYYLDRVLASETEYQPNSYNLDLHIFGEDLLEIPARFRGLF